MSTSNWRIGQSHISNKFTAVRFFTDAKGNSRAAPLLDTESGQIATFDTGDAALAGGRAFDMQVSA